MAVEIISNGSKWAGEEPDPLEQLRERLESCTLDPRFEAYGNFAHEEDDADFLARFPQYAGTWHLFGNFYDYSHVFCIRGPLDELAPIVDAIRANQGTPAYAQAKAEIEQHERERLEQERAQREEWRTARIAELQRLTEAV